MTTPQTQKPSQKAPETEVEAPKITKKALVQNLLEAEKGTTIEDVAKQTGWQKHTVRGHLSTMKKNNIVITSERIDGERRYFIKKQAD
jgi:predicted ArsR family transcriptional regulator